MSSLQDTDRDALKTAATKVSTHALIGSLVGIGLAGYLALRLRANRAAMYQSFRAADKPTHVKFANGREEKLPDIEPLLKPSRLGDVVTYLFFGTGGMFLGGELGLLSGSASARRTITKDPEMKARIEKAFRSFRVDVLKREIDELERGQMNSLLQI